MAVPVRLPCVILLVLSEGKVKIRDFIPVRTAVFTALQRVRMSRTG